VKVKICGIRTFEEAMLAIDAGADLLGFNFYPQSPRYIVPGECMRLVVRLEEALR
jgi:phosphoribosylanthranilate isomerase